MPKDLDNLDARKWFAEDIREAAPVVNNSRIVDVFASVPREQYLGQGPWNIHSRLSIGSTHKSASADPNHLYHDVLISIDDASGINNGLPSLWAMVFDNLNIKPGDTVLQVGAGVGYYTAILAELVTDQGHVIAYEIEDDLAKRAQENLRHYQQVEIVAGNAAEADSFPELDVVVACAGVTHVPEKWLMHLSENGQMVLPFTGENQWGFLLHLQKIGDDLPIKSLGPCSFYHCFGARIDDEEQALTSALNSTEDTTPNIGRYHLGLPKNNQLDTWVIGNSYWISRSTFNKV